MKGLDDNKVQGTRLSATSIRLALTEDAFCLTKGLVDLRSNEASKKTKLFSAKIILLEDFLSKAKHKI